MHYHTYPHIENHYLSAFIEKIYRNVENADEIEWEITEKIHGTNVQIATDGVEVRIGKRSSPITEDENFYNALNVMKFMHEPTIHLWRHLKNVHPNMVQLVLYGELFGGCYPHPDVPAVIGESKIQQGIWYSPVKSWMCFDMAIEYDNGTFEFISPSMKRWFCTTHDIPHVPVLGVVKGLKAALDWSNSMPSRVYSRFNLPEIEGNSMEGIVMKPEFYDIEMGFDRCIVKSKNPDFEDKKRGNKIVVPKEIPLNVQEALDKIAPYCTKARVESAISKIGECTHRDIGKVVAASSKDIVEEVQKELNVYDMLDKTEQRSVNKFISNEMAKFAKDILLR